MIRQIYKFIAENKGGKLELIYKKQDKDRNLFKMAQFTLKYLIQEK